MANRQHNHRVPRNDDKAIVREVKQPAKLLDYVMQTLDGISRNKAKSILAHGGVTVDGRILGIDQVSAGTQDQIYLALRLAIMDCLSPDEKLPLILDDAFARYDEDRLEQVLRILAGEAEERQILIFTCQNREIDTLKRLKQDYSLLELQAQ